MIAPRAPRQFGLAPGAGRQVTAERYPMSHSNDVEEDYLSIQWAEEQSKFEIQEAVETGQQAEAGPEPAQQHRLAK